MESLWSSVDLIILTSKIVIRPAVCVKSKWDRQFYVFIFINI